MPASQLPTSALSRRGSSPSPTRIPVSRKSSISPVRAPSKAPPSVDSAQTSHEPSSSPEAFIDDDSLQVDPEATWLNTDSDGQPRSNRSSMAPLSESDEERGRRGPRAAAFESSLMSESVPALFDSHSDDESDTPRLSVPSRSLPSPRLASSASAPLPIVASFAKPASKRSSGIPSSISLAAPKSPSSLSQPALPKPDSPIQASNPQLTLAQQPAANGHVASVDDVADHPAEPQRPQPPTSPQISRVLSAANLPSATAPLSIRAPAQSLPSLQPLSQVPDLLSPLSATSPMSPPFKPAIPSSLAISFSDIDADPVAQMPPPENIVSIASAALAASAAASPHSSLPVSRLSSGRPSDTSRHPFQVPSEPTVPLRQYEQLQSEIKLLMEAREEDKKRFANVDEIEAKLLTVESSLAALSEKHSRAQTELRELRTKCRDLADDKTRLEKELVEAHDVTEMALLDKEIAEEHVDTLKGEAKLLHERIEELTLELDVAKGERDLLMRGEHLNPGNSESHPQQNILQLELQNERLREALIKLRDVSLANEKMLQEKVEYAQSNSDAFKTLQEDHDKTKEKLRTALENVEDLKERLDDALGAEELVQSLTDTNLRLSEKLDKMKGNVEELETLRDLNNDLEEAHLDIQKMLVDEISIKDAVISELGSRITAQRDALLDCQSTIAQFRELVHKLQRELRERPQQVAEPENFDEQQLQNDLKVHVRTMSAVNMELQSALEKVNAQRIEMDVNRLEKEQAVDELRILRLFVPDEYIRSDHDVVQCLLLLRRLDFKSQMIAQHYSLQLRMPNSIERSNYAMFIDISSVLLGIEQTAKRLRRALDTTSDQDAYLRFGRLYHQLLALETSIDNVRSDVRSDIPDDAANLSTLNHCLDKIVEFLQQYVGESDHSTPALRFALLTAALEETNHYVERIELESVLISHLFAMGDRNDGGPFYASLNTLATTKLPSLLDYATAHVQKCRDAVSHLRHRLDALQSNQAVPKTDLSHRILETLAPLRGLSKFITNLRVKMREMIEECKQRRQEINYDAITNLLQDMSFGMLGGFGRDPGDAFAKQVEAVLSALAAFETALQSKDQIEAVPPVTKAWSWRAQVLKADFALNAELKQRVADLDKQIISMSQEMAAKRDQVGEAAVKIQVLMKNLEKAEKQATRTAEVEEQLKDSRQELGVYVDALQKLHKDLEDVENENMGLKKKLHRLEKSSLQGAAPKRPQTPSGVSAQAAGIQRLAESGSSSSLATSSTSEWGLVLEEDVVKQIDAQRAAIRFLMSENAKLTATAEGAYIQELMHPADPLMKRVLRHDTAKDHKTHGSPRLDMVMDPLHQQSRSLAAQAKEISSEARALSRDLRDMQLNTRVVDIAQLSSGATSRSSAQPTRKWMPLNLDPDVQLHKQQQLMRDMANRAELLKQSLSQHQIDSRLHRSSAAAAAPPGSAAAVHIASTPDAIAGTAPRAGAPLGRVRVPATLIRTGAEAPTGGAAVEAARCIEFSSQHDLHRFHSMFVS
nr:hypothetical protein HK105_000455 [Polyrhizophydium stewartii]